MRQSKLISFNFMALCCVLGLITKKMINPFANIITEFLHIPGGVSTGFSIMFLIIAVELIRMPRCGTLMASVQGIVALLLGRVGSMGILMPLCFIATGIAIDFVYYIQNHMHLSKVERIVFANSLAAFVASLVANLLVFQLNGPVLWLYLCVSATSGACYGLIGNMLVERLQMALGSHFKERLS